MPKKTIKYEYKCPECSRGKIRVYLETEDCDFSFSDDAKITLKCPLCDFTINQNANKFFFDKDTTPKEKE